ncbi:MAG: VanW family protein, partial [Christensenellaceae bacterium]|nr:VanW family protein [Christensenellaceae bacterium]
SVAYSPQCDRIACAHSLSFSKDGENGFCENFYEFSEPTSSFETNYETSASERKSNIKLASQKLDGVIILPNQVLSFNEIVGSRTFKNGYRTATIIESGKFTQGLGGGVCQVSTTLYVAALLSGFEIAEYRAHSLPVSYVPLSLDAAVSEKIDLKIKNPYPTPVLIKTEADGKILRISVYCENPSPNLKVKLRSKMLKELEATMTDKDDTDGVLLETETEKIIIPAHSGYLSESYMDYIDQSGAVVSTIKIRTDRYLPQNGERIIRSESETNMLKLNTVSVKV